MGDRRRVYLNKQVVANAVNFLTLKGGFDAEFVGKTAPFNKHNGLIVETWRNGEGDVAHVILAHPYDTDEDVQHVFERYQRCASQREGRGLGLYIAKLVVDAHGGKIWAESTVDIGSEFHVVLPKLQPNVQPPQVTH